MNTLNTEQQIQKLNRFKEIASYGESSTCLAEKLGAFIIYAGFVDFMVIQAAKVIEQIILNERVTTGSKQLFQPHSDIYFYGNQINTRNILKVIKKYLPFKSENNDEGEKLTNLAKNMIKICTKFLNYRNPIVHHIGSPNKGFEEVVGLCEKAIMKYHEFQEIHKQFMEVASPYTLTNEQRIELHN